jgi:hypothetical protein
MIKVLIMGGHYVSEDHISSFLQLIQCTEELQSYTTHKLYFALTENTS